MGEYTTIRVRGPDGKIIYSRGNNDAIHRAVTLARSKGVTLKEIAQANDMKIAHNSNAGQYSMALHSSLRGLVRNNASVKIGTVRVTALDQDIHINEAEVGEAPKGAKKAKKAKKAVKKRAKKAAVHAEAA